MAALIDRFFAACLLVFACMAPLSAHAVSTTAVACGDVFGDCVRQDGVELVYATNGGDRIYDRSFTAMAEAAPGALRARVQASTRGDDGGGQEPRVVADFSDVIHFNAPADVQVLELTVSISLNGHCEDNCVAQLGATFGRGLNSINLNLFQEFPATKSVTLLWDLRDTLPVYGFLDVRCRSRWGLGCTADFAHTGSLTVASSLKTVTAIGESGHNYAPVPEPQAVVLGLAGLALLWGRGRIRLRDAMPGRG